MFHFHSFFKTSFELLGTLFLIELHFFPRCRFYLYNIHLNIYLMLFLKIKMRVGLLVYISVRDSRASYR
ncbi:unnamed protein product [Phytomonas sp. EM1]|nr:unnamed protein product [Phytomonas sp. EM1]|eukprot:CCW62843.1 unnamed protein product [Phytomonas sp. isolate EM1]